MAVQGVIRGFLLQVRAMLFSEDAKSVSHGEQALANVLAQASRQIDANNQKRGTPKYKGLQRLWLPIGGESKLYATLVLSIEKLSWLPSEGENLLLELTILITSQN